MDRSKAGVLEKIPDFEASQMETTASGEASLTKLVV